MLTSPLHILISMIPTLQMLKGYLVHRQLSLLTGKLIATSLLIEHCLISMYQFKREVDCFIAGLTSRSLAPSEVASPVLLS